MPEASLLALSDIWGFEDLQVKKKKVKEKLTGDSKKLDVFLYCQGFCKKENKRNRMDLPGERKEVVDDEQQTGGRV